VVESLLLVEELVEDVVSSPAVELDVNAGFKALQPILIVKIPSKFKNTTVQNILATSK